MDVVRGDAATSVTFREFVGRRPERCATGSGCASLRTVMPRGPQLDAPGTLHHIMVRGIERTTIFRDDTDRAGFLMRLAGLVERGAVTLYAWALLPNHAHLLLRTGARPLAQSMRSLLKGDVVHLLHFSLPVCRPAPPRTERYARPGLLPCRENPPRNGVMLRL